MNIAKRKELCARYLFGLLIAMFIHSAVAQNRPNIILIMTDDMGYSDLGCYGGEIDTPNIDSLAKNGLRFSQFYNNAVCMATRSSLLTGLYPSQGGFGPLSLRAVTIAEVLREKGYQTIQTGKWHLGAKDKKWWPFARGFDNTFSSPHGGGFYFRPSAFKDYRSVVRNGKILYDDKNDPPKSWYSTDAWTDEGLTYVEKALESKSPFFWYLAYNAPHWPIKAKPADVAKYRGKYMKGWDVLRRERYNRLVSMGMINKNWQLSERDKSIPESERDANIPLWNMLSDAEKDKQDLRMATYAAAIDSVDQNVGKIVKRLRKLNVLDNTLIMFLHDNGPDSGGGKLGRNYKKGKCGTVDSFVKYGISWANVSNSPFQRYKLMSHEGGISTPFIAHWPKGINEKLQGSIIHEPAHVIDIMPTCVSMSGAEYPKHYSGNKILPMEGMNLQSYFKDAELQETDRDIFVSYAKTAMVRERNWKLVHRPRGRWELYDMRNDRTEMNDLATKYPERVKSMFAKYTAWVKRCSVKH